MYMYSLNAESAESSVQKVDSPLILWLRVWDCLLLRPYIDDGAWKTRSIIYLSWALRYYAIIDHQNWWYNVSRLCHNDPTIIHDLNVHVLLRSHPATMLWPCVFIPWLGHENPSPIWWDDSTSVINEAHYQPIWAHDRRPLNTWPISTCGPI